MFSSSAEPINESLRFRGKAITVRAADLSGGEALRKTTIVGRTKGSCVVFDQGETPESILEGFALSEGRGSTVTSEAGSFTAGGGVLCVNSSPTIRRCWILACDTLYGGGIAIFGDSQARIVNCLITDNRARLGGAVLIRKEVARPTGEPPMRGPRADLRARRYRRPASLRMMPLRQASGPALINCTIMDNETERMAMSSTVMMWTAGTPGLSL